MARTVAEDRGGLMSKPFIHESAFVDDGARIGDDTKVWHFCHVLGGAVIGKGCFLGAGTVVTSDVEAYGLVVGVPGKRIGWMCQCGERLPDSGKGKCGRCGSTYEPDGKGKKNIRRTGGK